MRDMSSGSTGLNKIISLRMAQTAFAAFPRPYVFTNGVFDILHRGHVQYLVAARKLGASLIVGINTDTSVRLLAKGSDRPINGEADRAYILAALECVSAVTFFAELTPCELMQVIRPEIYVKGGDYDVDALAETHLIRSWGGRSQAIPFLEGYSTTSTLARLRATE